MTNFTNTIINIYLITTFSAFGYITYTKLQDTDNYFAAFLQMLDDPFIKLLLYSVTVSVATIMYKITIALFYEELKEN